MPYIKAADRAYFDQILEKVPENLEAGEVAYLLWNVALKFLRQEDISYARLALVDGILDTVHSELKRRVIFPYEDTKIIENGDAL